MNSLNFIEKSDAIHDQLMKVGSLVDLLEKGDFEAVTNWLLWLKESETILKNYNYSETSILSGLRANIITEQYSTENLRNKRKKAVATAASTVYPAQHVLFTIKNSLTEKINQVRMLIRQILIPAKEAGMIQSENITDFNQYVASLFQQFMNNEQLKVNFHNAIALIGKVDVMRIIAEELNFS